MTLQRAAPLAVALALAAAKARADTPACLASATLSTTRAFVGQAVEHRVRVLRRTDVVEMRWEIAPDLVGFRVAMEPGRFVENRVEREGRHYLVYEERRLLVALRPGRLAISPSRLECVLHSATHGASRSERVALGGAEVEAVSVPETGRPAEWSGVVGRTTLELRTSASEVVLGGAVRLQVTLTGEGNVWDARPPFGDARRLAGAELLPGPVSEAVDTVPVLRVRRSFAFDLVPHLAGKLVLPPQVVVYFDPASGRFEHATSRAAAIDVREAAAPGLERSRRDTEAYGEGGATAQRGALWPALAALGVIVASIVAGGVAVMRLRRHGRPPRPLAADPAQQAVDATDEATRLREVLARRLGIGGPAHGLTAQELLARCAPDSAEAEAAALLVRIERARFAASDAPPVDDGALRRTIRALGERV